MMLKKSGLAVLISAAVVLTFCSSSYTQGNSDEYFDHMETLIENFERIQAGMEVAFDPSLYIGNIQNLNFNHKKFSEAYRNRKERKYLSFALESSIVKTYMDLVEIIKTNSDRITLDVVNLAIDSNQLKITMLQNAVKIESTEGPMEAWVNLIEERIEAGEFASANEYVKLAREIYGSAKEFITLKVEIDDVLRKFDEDKEKAIQLMDEKEYRDALVILTQLKGTKPDDTEVARRYETAASYVEKMDELTLEAHSYEAEDKLKEAYRTWENLLDRKSVV